MTRTTPIFICGLLSFASGCGATNPRPTESTVDCSVLQSYEFKNINYFDSSDPGWYEYADPTKIPLGTTITAAYPPPAQAPVGPERVKFAEDRGLAVQGWVKLDPPGRCGDPDTAQMLKISAHGYNFWGSGFASYQNDTAPLVGTDYEGISFWARTDPGTEKTFMLYVDDGRTIVSTRAKPTAGSGILVHSVCQLICANSSTVVGADGLGLENNHQCVVRGVGADTGVPCDALSATGGNDEDLNGDGILDAGDIADATTLDENGKFVGTQCRVPPLQPVCDPACYYGGVQPPAAAPCVPASNECGNQFHKYITTTDAWQLFVIPWSELVQWPCPNRLVGGINPADVRKFEIKLRQGTNYRIYIDNMAFYRRRADAGS